jgi:hypothetical protein
MITQNDRLTEVIAHFIGYFEVKLEEMRSRLDYDAFDALRALLEHEGASDPHAVRFVHPFDIEPFLPDVGYVGPGWVVRGDSPAELLTPKAIYFELPTHFWADPLSSLPLAVPGSYSAMPPVFFGPHPGSVMAVVSQSIELQDNDVLIMPSAPVSVDYHFGAVPKFQNLTDDALATAAPFVSAGPIGSTAEMVTLVANTSAAIAAADAPGSGDVVASGPMVSGNYVDGQTVETLPDLDASLPPGFRQEAAEGADVEMTDPDALEVATGDFAPSVTLEAGGNLLANDAQLVDAGLTSSFISVSGNVHRLDAIVQTNAYADSDIAGLGFGDAINAAPTMASNIASFTHETLDTAALAAAAAPDLMPLTWSVTMVEGDVVFLNWVQQYNFVSDSDVCVVTATGSQTTVTAGANLNMNGVGILELGLYYDLVIVGGNLYDANLIYQTNVLFDDDTLEMLGFTTDFKGAAETGGNLLWNAAAITNVGATEWQQGVPEHYLEAAAGFTDGDYAMPGAFSLDGAFEGFPLLKVLYISGDLYDVNYLEQVNVLGDADYVALHQQQVMAAHPDTVWNIATGSNALVNSASILDYDTVGDTAYVGGELYSDAILIQADLVDAGPNVLGAQQDDLASEVIAFLDDDVPAYLPTPEIVGGHASTDGPTADVMQAVLA